MKILVLEDDNFISKQIKTYFELNNHTVDTYDNGEDLLENALLNSYDIFLLDINTPRKNGIETLRYIRKDGITTPAIFLTALSNIDDVKLGYDAGCNDYVKKPFDLEELDLRIKNIKKRFSIENEEIIKIFPNTSLITQKHKLFIDNNEYKLTQKECEILLYFHSHRKIVISSEELIRNLWEYEDMPTDTTIRVYIKNLRLLLGKDAITTIRGIGYYFE